MAQTIAPQTTFASGRYSKRKRTQVNYRMEEMDVDEAETESEEEFLKPKKQRKTAASRPLPKRKIFPFLELPAEIRNIIYSYALTDTSGINFVAVQRNRRRSVQRVSDKTFNQISGNGMYYQSIRINDDADDQPAALVPSLLAVNKQIHREGCDMLYSNELVFADSIALYAFMINAGPAGASHIKKIRLNGWGYGRTSKAYNNACFAVLIWATNLEKFRVDSLAVYWRRVRGSAQQFYRDAFPWLEAVGSAKGKFDAALDIIELTDKCLDRSYHADSNAQSVFKDELSMNLARQQKRVMAKSVKRRKISKVSGDS
ncbi:hypothetical protein E8E13_005079 [Curvularia kusanoi]|uniref:DUF7730 domain-containing protein n=1 Tax=Curvularia kusanoi TaxID=90978 RepID=A0A9P4W7H8_CURKU|nr:hypothetical protein E8E13_005079 [Curvularia kusanoi]